MKTTTKEDLDLADRSGDYDKHGDWSSWDSTCKLYKENCKKISSKEIDEAFEKVDNLLHDKSSK